jgi:exopolysaccharide biosynthesis polyprenyl glycosylphosphotransferase
MYKKTLKGWLKHIDFVLIDIIMVQLAYVFAYWMRHGIYNPYRINIYAMGGLVLVIAGLINANLAENYKNILRRGYFEEFKAVIRYLLVCAMLLMTYQFVAKTSRTFSRIVFFYFLVYAFGMLYVSRLVWKFIVNDRISRMVKSKRHMLLVSHSQMAGEMIRRFDEHTNGEVEITGLALVDDGLPVGEKVEDVEVVSSYYDVVSYIQKTWVDEVFIYLPKGIPAPEKLLDQCAQMGITTHQSIDVENNREVMSAVENFGGYTVITESLRIASTKDLTIKRLMDIAGGLVGLLFTGILCIFIAPAIYFSDPGPIFFAQERIGKNGRTFKLYKFRSMYKDAEERKKELMARNEMQGLMFKMEDDPRIIGSGPDGKKHGIGWFIRKTSIDEFPQFWNVLKGDMSLVGTRPPTVQEYEQYEIHHKARLAIKPGLTGLWQVSGRSKITDFEEVVALDLKYINTWTIAQDIVIILKTVQVLFTGEGAR